MSTVIEIEKALQTLPVEEAWKVADWLQHYLDAQGRHSAAVRFEKRGGYTVGVSDQPVSAEAIKGALAEFP